MGVGYLVLRPRWPAGGDRAARSVRSNCERRIGDDTSERTSSRVMTALAMSASHGVIRELISFDHAMSQSDARRRKELRRAAATQSGALTRNPVLLTESAT